MSDKLDDVCCEVEPPALPHRQRDKARRVRGMFDAIAPTYELINFLASMGRDGYWRSQMVRLAEVRSEDVLLDIASGTGDVARTFGSASVRPRRIIGFDFSLGMLARAVARPIVGGTFCQADALNLPLADESVSIVSCAFGIRNFQDLSSGLREMYRVLGVGGRSVILEFSVPRRPILRRLYLLYFHCLMPIAATLMSRDRTGAYRYLPNSVLSFEGPDEVISMLQAAGFSNVSVYPLTMGIVTVYVARKDTGKRITN